MRLSDREKKLLLLAFDPAASGGEAANALRVVFRDWITKYPDGHELVKDLEGWEGRIVERNPYGDVVLGFGKHRGKRLSEIDPAYLLWVLSNFEGLWPETRKAIERYLKEK